MAEVIRRKRSAPQAAVIEELTPKIRGWANFTSTLVSKRIYSTLDHLLWRILWRWSVRRHPTKSRGWIKDRYWTTIGHRDWIFRDRRTAAQLPFHADRGIVRHMKVRGNASLYDGNLLYWAQRLQAHPELPDRVMRLMKDQHGRCAWCQHYFLSMDDVWEVDHMIPRKHGGFKRVHNTQLLHGHCHDRKTATDGSNLKVVWRFHDSD
jgi:RNA-directed DNA polymerase